MYQIYKLALFKLKIMCKDKVFLAAMLIIPLGFTLLTGSAQSYEKQNLIPVVVVDNDQSDYSRLIVQRLARKQGIKVLYAGESKAVDLVENYKAEVAFIIKKGFKDSILNESIEESITLIKSPNSLSYGIIQEILASEVIRLAANTSAANRVIEIYNKYGLQLPNQPRDLWSDAWSYADSLWEPEPLMKLEYKELEGTAVKKVEHRPVPVISSSSTGMLIMFLMLLIMFNSSWLIEERNNSTLKRLVLVPGLLAKFYIANMVALFFTSALQVFLFVLITKVIFGVIIFTSYLQYLVLAAYILAVIALGMLFSATFRTQAQLQTGAPVLALLTGFLGGCFWSFLDPPGTLKSLALLTPQGWALNSLKDIMVKDYDITFIVISVAVLLLSGLVISIFSYRRIRRMVSA